MWFVCCSIWVDASFGDNATNHHSWGCSSGKYHDRQVDVKWCKSNWMQWRVTYLFLFLLLSLHSEIFSVCFMFFSLKVSKNHSVWPSDLPLRHPRPSSFAWKTGGLTLPRDTAHLKLSRVISGLYTTLQSFHIWKMIRLKMMYLYTCLL